MDSQSANYLLTPPTIPVPQRPLTSATARQKLHQLFGNIPLHLRFLNNVNTLRDWACQPTLSPCMFRNPHRKKDLIELLEIINFFSESEGLISQLATHPVPLLNTHLKKFFQAFYRHQKTKEYEVDPYAFRLGVSDKMQRHAISSGVIDFSSLFDLTSCNNSHIHFKERDAVFFSGDNLHAVENNPGVTANTSWAFFNNQYKVQHEAQKHRLYIHAKYDFIEALLQEIFNFFQEKKLAARFKAYFFLTSPTRKDAVVVYCDNMPALYQLANQLANQLHRQCPQYIYPETFTDTTPWQENPSSGMSFAPNPNINQRHFNSAQKIAYGSFGSLVSQIAIESYRFVNLPWLPDKTRETAYYQLVVLSLLTSGIDALSPVNLQLMQQHAATDHLNRFREIPLGHKHPALKNQPMEAPF